MADLYFSTVADKKLPKQRTDILGKVNNFDSLKDYVDGTDALIEQNYGGKIPTGAGTNVSYAFHKVYGSIEDSKAVNLSLISKHNTSFGRNTSQVGNVFITKGVYGRYISL